jgi:hypothetical protein
MHIGGHRNQLRKAENRTISESRGENAAHGAGKFDCKIANPLNLCISPPFEAFKAKYVAAM